MKLYSDGHLTQVSALPVLTELNVHRAPVLETHASRLVGAIFNSGFVGGSARRFSSISPVDAPLPRPGRGGGGSTA
ncbi:hypothetical protein EB232_33605 [Mesorhizobium sp. NZP2077]|nr:hypothetical protein EB232_33605 [Mesorhizobium sp. NZP2077]